MLRGIIQIALTLSSLSAFAQTSGVGTLYVTSSSWAVALKDSKSTCATEVIQKSDNHEAMIASLPEGALVILPTEITRRSVNDKSTGGATYQVMYKAKSLLGGYELESLGTNSFSVPKVSDKKWDQAFAKALQESLATLDCQSLAASVQTKEVKVSSFLDTFEPTKIKFDASVKEFAPTTISNLKLSDDRRLIVGRGCVYLDAAGAKVSGKTCIATRTQAGEYKVVYSNDVFLAGGNLSVSKRGLAYLSKKSVIYSDVVGLQTYQTTLDVLSIDSLYAMDNGQVGIVAFVRKDAKDVAIFVWDPKNNSIVKALEFPEETLGKSWENLKFLNDKEVIVARPKSADGATRFEIIDLWKNKVVQVIQPRVNTMSIPDFSRTDRILNFVELGQVTQDNNDAREMFIDSINLDNPNAPTGPVLKTVTYVGQKKSVTAPTYLFLTKDKGVFFEHNEYAVGGDEHILVSDLKDPINGLRLIPGAEYSLRGKPQKFSDGAFALAYQYGDTVTGSLALVIFSPRK